MSNRIAPTLMHNIGSRLAELRKSRGLTQGELAGRVGTVQESISRIERGAGVPSLDFINRLAGALGAEVDISFKPLSGEETGTPDNSSIDREYVCVNCLYHWYSRLERPVIQCPRCHQRKGVLYSEYDKALKAFQDMQRDVRASPPFKKAPPLKGLTRHSLRILETLLQTAGKTFPSPRLPVSLLFRIIEQSGRKDDV